MINYCSASKNGNSIPNECLKRPELLWVRFCDRLEAIGVIGAIRCYQFGLEKGEPMHLPGITPRPKTIKQLWSFVTPARFIAYQNSGGKGSISMIDHNYDKLL